jgi:lycopene cyclase domain-containing protein
MTYFSFLLRFLLIPILILLAIAWWDNKRDKQIHGFRNGRAVWTAIGIHVLLAVLYTTPWDNYLVATGVWYYNRELVTGFVLGYVPVEEYTFFVLETILAGLWWWFLARRLSPPRFVSAAAPLTHLHLSLSTAQVSSRRFIGSPAEFKPNKNLVYLSTCVLVCLWLLFTYLFFFGAAKWTYLSITLFWALPAILPQLLFGADILWHYRRLVAISFLIPTTYLSLIDIVALKGTTWSISPSQTTGLLFFGILPLEEVVFFFITNVLLAFGITLLLADVSQARFAAIKAQARSWKERWKVRPQSR